MKEFPGLKIKPFHECRVVSLSDPDLYYKNRWSGLNHRSSCKNGAVSGSQTDQSDLFYRNKWRHMIKTPYPTRQPSFKDRHAGSENHSDQAVIGQTIQTEIH